jgi:hypothetical protein
MFPTVSNQKGFSMTPDAPTHPVLSTDLSGQIIQALESGVPIESVIATLAVHVETLRIALPIVNAVRAAGWSPT